MQSRSKDISNNDKTVDVRAKKRILNRFWSEYSKNREDDFSFSESESTKSEPIKTIKNDIYDNENVDLTKSLPSKITKVTKCKDFSGFSSFNVEISKYSDSNDKLYTILLTDSNGRIDSFEEEMYTENEEGKLYINVGNSEKIAIREYNVIQIGKPTKRNVLSLQKQYLIDLEEKNIDFDSFSVKIKKSHQMPYLLRLSSFTHINRDEFNIVRFTGVQINRNKDKKYFISLKLKAKTQFQTSNAYKKYKDEICTHLLSFNEEYDFFYRIRKFEFAPFDVECTIFEVWKSGEIFKVKEIETEKFAINNFDEPITISTKRFSGCIKLEDYTQINNKELVSLLSKDPFNAKEKNVKQITKFDKSLLKKNLLIIAQWLMYTNVPSAKEIIDILNSISIESENILKLRLGFQTAVKFMKEYSEFDQRNEIIEKIIIDSLYNSIEGGNEVYDYQIVEAFEKYATKISNLNKSLIFEIASFFSNSTSIPILCDFIDKNNDFNVFKLACDYKSTKFFESEDYVRKLLSVIETNDYKMEFVQLFTEKIIQLQDKSISILYIYNYINNNSKISDKSAAILLYAITIKSNIDDIKSIMQNEPMNDKFFNEINKEFYNMFDSASIHEWVCKMLISTHKIQFITVLDTNDSIEVFSPLFITALNSFEQKELSEFINENYIYMIIYYSLSTLLQKEDLTQSFTELYKMLMSFNCFDTNVAKDSIKSAIVKIISVTKNEIQVLIPKLLEKIQIALLSDRKISKSYLRIETTLDVFSETISFANFIIEINKECNKLTKIIKMVDLYQNMKHFFKKETSRSLLQYLQTLYKEIGLDDDVMKCNDLLNHKSTNTSYKRVLVQFPETFEMENKLFSVNDSENLEFILQNEYGIQVSRNDNGIKRALKQSIITIIPTTSYGVKLEKAEENSFVFVNFDFCSCLSFSVAQINETSQRIVSNADILINSINESLNRFIYSNETEISKSMKELQSFMKPLHCATLSKACQNIAVNLDEPKRKELMDVMNLFYSSCITKLSKYINRSSITAEVNETILTLCDLKFE